MTIDKILKSGLLLCIAALAACSSDNDPQRPDPAFPEKQTLEIKPGETLQVQFDAPHAWRLASDKTWVRFISGDPAEESPLAYGPAGTNTVTLLMKPDGQLFDAETASLSMTMENRSQTVFEVTRPAKVREITLMTSPKLDTPFAQAQQVELAYPGTVFVGFEANFDWKISAWPEWMSPMTRITGSAGEQVTFNNADLVRADAISEAKLPFAQQGEIVVSPRRGEGPSFRFPIVYTGMDDLIQKLTPSPFNNTFYFNHDTYYGKYNPSNSQVEFTDQKQIEFQVLTQELKRRTLVVAYDTDKRQAIEVPLAESWLTCTVSPENPAQITLSANEQYEQREDRMLYLYFLPPYYLENEYDFAADFRFVQNKVTFSGTKYGRMVAQLGKQPTEGFEITDALTLGKLPAPVKVTDRDDLVAKYGTTNIYARAFTQAEWDNNHTFSIEVFGINGTATPELAQSAKWGTFEGGTNKFSIRARVKFASLPEQGGEVVIRKLDQSIHGVLLISKAAGQ